MSISMKLPSTPYNINGCRLSRAIVQVNIKSIIKKHRIASPSGHEKQKANQKSIYVERKEDRKAPMGREYIRN